MTMQSPTPKFTATATLTFANALKEVVSGEKVTKLEWNSHETFLFMQAGILHIHNETGDHVLKVSDGDILGEDYVII